MSAATGPGDPGTSARARADVLARIRAALGPSPQPPPVPRGYRVAAPLDHETLLDLFSERVCDYRASVRRTTLADLPSAIGAALAEQDARRVVVPAGLPGGWVRDGIRDEPQLTADQLDDVDAVVTGCAVGIAQTGTLVLDGGPDQGRRAVTLVPDLHVCVIRASQVVHLVPEAIARLEPTRPLTLISGPSATSDIELDRVEGVHGPRTLVVMLATDG